MSEIIVSSGKEPKAKVQDGSRITLHFALLLPTGEEVDTTCRGQPATLTVGDGNLLPGFEAVLIGLQEGDDAQITIPAVDAFGERNPQRNHAQRSVCGVCCGTESEPVMISFQAPDGELPGWSRKYFLKPLRWTSITRSVAMTLSLMCLFSVEDPVATEAAQSSGLLSRPS